MQEYFITYYTIEYPGCRTNGGKNKDGQVKDCFEKNGCHFKNKSGLKTIFWSDDKNVCNEKLIRDNLNKPIDKAKPIVRSSARSSEDKCIYYGKTTCDRFSYCAKIQCPEMTRQAVYRVPLEKFDDEERDLFIEITGIAIDESSFRTNGRPEFSLDTKGESKKEQLEHERLCENFNNGPVDHLKGWGESVVFIEKTYKQLAARITSLRSPNTPIGVPDMPLVSMAASGKGNPPTIPLAIHGEETLINPAEPMGVYIQSDDAQVLENAVLKGSLRANFILQHLEPKERNILLHETLGIGATEIARRDGTPEGKVRSKAQTIQKQLDRMK